MKFFLTIKHWQLFILQFALPFLLQIIFIGLFIFYRNPLLLAFFMPLFLFLIAFNHYGWLYTLAINLHRKLPNTVEISLTRFKFFFCFPAVYLIAIIAVAIFLLSSDFSMENSWPFSAFFLVIPLHLFAIFCNFYCLYFIAKALKSVELEREASFSDYASEFFLFWFSIVGIWIMQPRINKLFDQNSSGLIAREIDQ
jgi:hypothetical protein